MGESWRVVGGKGITAITAAMPLVEYQGSGLMPNRDDAAPQPQPMTSIPPMYGFSTSGTTTLPSACW